MKLVTLLLLLLPFTAHAKEVIYDVQILRVIDGDTVVISAPWIPQPLKPEISIRVLGVDTPEHAGRAQCDIEARNADASTQFTQQAIAASKKQQVIFKQWDKYGGRILGDVLLDDRSLTDMLIQNGYAREYHGEKKTSWCN